MRYYTAEEVAKKLKISKGHVYELVKRGQIKKKEGMGRSIRIPSTELGKVSTERNYFTYNTEKIEVINTHLGKVRKVKEKDEYVVSDLAKILGLKDSYTITRRADKKQYKKIDVEEAQKLGIFANSFGLLLITYKGIVQYSKKSRSKDVIHFDRLLKELKVSNYEQAESKEEKDTKLQIFNNEEFGELNVINFENKKWFIGKYVADTLGYLDTKSAIRDHVDDEDKLLIQKGQITTLEIPNRGMTIINESGLYSLILKSKLPQAKKFKRWVTNEVLPKIRTTGGYVDNSNKFVDNYFANLSLEVRKAIKQELVNRNKVLVNRKRELIVEAEELKREYELNKKTIEQLDI